jgi:hypothetical protein
VKLMLQVWPDLYFKTRKNWAYKDEISIHSCCSTDH